MHLSRHGSRERDICCGSTGKVSSCSINLWLTSSGLWQNAPNVLSLSTRLTIRCSIIKRLQEEISNPAAVCVAFFYCNGNFPEKMEARYIFGSIMRQLISPSNNPTDPKSPRGRHLQRFYDNNHAQLRISDIIESVKWLSRFYKKTYIVVDALDECSRITEVCSMLLKLEVSSLKVLAISRPESEIKAVFTDVSQLSMDELAIRADIGIYIDWRLEHDVRLRKIKPDLKRHIKERLLRANDGM